MPMLDLSALGAPLPFGGLLNSSQGFPAAETPSDEAAKAQEARDAAAAILARKIKGQRNGPFEAPDENAPAITYAMGNAPVTPQPTSYGSLAPQLPQPAADASPPAAASAIVPPAPSIPLPQPRPAEAPAIPQIAPAASGSTDISAQSKPPASDESTPAVPGSSLFGRLQKGVSDNSNLLLGLASGFAGAPSLGAGMSRGFAGAAAGGQLDTKAQQIALQQGTARSTYEALVAAGAPRNQAIVAAYNPDSAISKKLIDSYIGDRKGELKNIKLPNGTEISVLHNPYTQEVTDLQGKKLDLGNIAGGPIDPSLTGPAAAEAAQKADPALYKRAVALVEGRETWPTGRALIDPKNKAATDLARQIDPQLTEQRAMERNQYAKDAGNTSFAKVGGQVKAFHQGIEHFLQAAKGIEKYNPSGGMGLEPVAGAINAASELTTHQKDLANSINAAVQTGAGEVGKLFSNGGTGHERAETAGRFKSTNSGPASAGALESTIETMEGGLRAIEANRDRVMGEAGSKAPELQFRNKETDAKIAEIKQIIGRLRGEQAAQQPAETGKLPPGKYIWSPDKGVQPQ